MISYGGAGVHDERTEELHADDRVDEEQDHHQHTNVRQGLQYIYIVILYLLIITTQN